MTNNEPADHERPRPDNEREELARQIITAGLSIAESAARPIDVNTARILAATLHGGPRSALERYAATGGLNRARAADELQRVDRELSLLGRHDPDHPVIREQRRWTSALRKHIESAADDGDKDDETEPRPGAHPHPAIYVMRAPSTDEPAAPGKWLDATTTALDLFLEIAPIVASGLQEPRDWRIPITAGFYDLDIPDDVSLSTLSRVAIGIADYGEAYAAFVDWQGWHVPDEEFTRHYVGTFDSTEQMSRAYLDRQAWTQELATFIERTQLPVLIDFDLADVAALLHTYWRVIEGSVGLHAFSP